MKLNLEQKVDLILEQVTEHGRRFESMDRQFDRILEKVTEHDRLFVSIDKRFDGIDQRLGSVEATLDVVAVEVVNLRGDMDEVKVRVGSLEHRFDDGFTKLDAYVTEMNRQNLEILANRSGIFRHEERIGVLEGSA